MTEFLKIAKKSLFVTLTLLLLSNCARDLSDNVYTSDSTLGLTMQGKVLSVRSVIIKESDKLGDNTTGMMAGGALGGIAGNSMGHGNGKAAAMVGGAVVAGALGAAAQGALSKSNGYEYVVAVDTSKINDDYFQGNSAMRNVIATAKVNGMITVVQAGDKPLSKDDLVYVIFSNKRTRIIPRS